MGRDKLFSKRSAALTRQAGRRPVRRILIVCEGEKTEPNYFKAFPEKPEVFDDVDIRGTGYNTVSLVKEAVRLRDRACNESRPYIEAWCVFDKDSFTDEAFSTAIRLAESSRIQCAYSIEAFELWYLLHFQYCDAGLHRSQYKDVLTRKLGRPYVKNDGSMYRTLEGRQGTAIRNATRLYNEQVHLPCHRRNPVTTVYKLVERLNG